MAQTHPSTRTAWKRAKGAQLIERKGTLGHPQALPLKLAVSFCSRDPGATAGVAVPCDAASLAFGRWEMNLESCVAATCYISQHELGVMVWKNINVLFPIAFLNMERALITLKHSFT